MVRKLSHKVYGQYCPVARSLDVIGDRWTLLIVRDLLRGKQRFKDLQSSLAGIAPNLLSDRLKRLEEAGLIVRTFFKQLPPKVEYALTERGRRLDVVLASLSQFGMVNLMGHLERTEVIDPELIFQAMPSVFIPSSARGVKAVYEFNITSRRGGTWYVAIGRSSCKVSKSQPREPDVVIKTDAKTLAMVATGQMEPDEAEASKRLESTGDKALADRFVTFFLRGNQQLSS